MKIQEIRIARLQEFVEDAGGAAAVERLYEVNASYIAQLINKHRPFGEKSARKIEGQCKLVPFYFDSYSTKPGEQKKAEQNQVDYLINQILSQMDERTKLQYLKIGNSLVEPEENGHTTPKKGHQ